VPSRGGAPGEADVVAALVVRDKDGFDAQAAFARCARELERSHVPDFIQLLDDFPRTASQKVQSRLLVHSFDPAQPHVFARDRR
jgi:carnitine-CoA ligase